MLNNISRKTKVMFKDDAHACDAADGARRPCLFLNGWLVLTWGSIRRRSTFPRQRGVLKASATTAADRLATRGRHDRRIWCISRRAQTVIVLGPCHSPPPPPPPIKKHEGCSFDGDDMGASHLHLRPPPPPPRFDLTHFQFGEKMAPAKTSSGRREARESSSPRGCHLEEARFFV